MTRISLLIACVLTALISFAQAVKRDAAVVRNYIRSCVGEAAIKAIQGREGGGAFLKRFFADQRWMEQFAGSGPWSIDPYKGLKENNELAAKALEALDLLVWNDEGDFISTTIGRNIATALALSHGHDWDGEKLVRVMELYREWAGDGTLHVDSKKYDVRQWREVLGFGQNANLPVECLEWIHDFANVPSERYPGLCWQCHYRTFNCFGASVHGPQYYAPWEHRWNTQELRYRIGGVCGALSKFGSHGAASHGVRSFTAGQPGHCAYLVWNRDDDRWGTAYSVTGHTAPHNTLGGHDFAALEEQDRYYRNPKRMDAEYLRWKGEWEKSMRLCPGNWSAAVAWYCDLERRSASAAEWDAWAAAVRDTFAEAPSQGWQLYLPYLERIKGRDARLSAAKLALAAMKENKAPTVEAPYWADMALKPLDKLFPKDDKAMWEVFQSALDGQAGTPTFYRQTITWGAERLMADAAASKTFLAVVGKSAEKTGEKLDYKGMVLKASQSGDITMFRQVYSLMSKLSPGEEPKAKGKPWPTEAYGGTLLSPDGLLQTSGTSSWENPVTYRSGLTAADFDSGNAFHTAKEKAPWGMVVLPGSSDITGVTIVNVPGQNSSRQVPIRVWTSDDGGEFTEVFASESNELEWKCQFKKPVKAKYIKVGRAPDAKEEFFHLRKILVYGKKLY